MNVRMFGRVCLYLVAMGFVATGLLYMFYGSPMPYHLDGMQAEWGDIPPQQQVVIMAILRGSASGLLASGVAIAMLTFFALDTAAASWARWCILLVGMIETLPTIHSVQQVQTHTPGDPPMAVLVLCAALVPAGLLASAGASPPRR